MADLQHSIKANWHPPKESESKSCSVTFSIHHGGQLSHVRIERPSGESTVDAAALTAVHDSTPLSALPAGDVPKVFISFSFDYNVHLRNAANSSSSRSHSAGRALGDVLRTLPLYVP
jgi:TonB family protein